MGNYDDLRPDPNMIFCAVDHVETGFVKLRVEKSDLPKLDARFPGLCGEQRNKLWCFIERGWDSKFQKMLKTMGKSSKSCTFAKGTYPQGTPETHADLRARLGHVPFL